MTDTAKKSSGLREFLIRTLADPVLLYTVLLIMSIMYHYRNSLAFAYGALAYVAGWFVFRVFDFVCKHHIIGFFACVILYVTGLSAALRCMDIGAENYPITWSLWFFTPQDSLKYNKWYTLAIFILFLFFMLSVVYYFTRVQYRIFMNFLIFIIPFTIYGKEYEKMPIGYIIALAVGYVLMMAAFRQLHESEKEILVNKGEAWKSVAVFAMLFAMLSTLFPKPVVHEDRTILESLINADAFTDRLNQMLDVFRDTSTGEQFRGRISDKPVYYMEGGEPMRLRTATFSTYDYNSDRWEISELDSEYLEKDELPIEFHSGRCVAEALLYAAECDSDFAEEYGLTGLTGKKLTKPELQEATLHSVTEGETVPLPQGVTSLKKTSFRNPFDITDNEVLLTKHDTLYGFDTFTFEYMPQSFFSSDENLSIIEALGSVDDYDGMIMDAYEVLYQNSADEYGKMLSESYIFYNSYKSNLLDYGSDKDIYDLAQTITEGCDTEYDKAKEIEWYFVTNGFKYDLDYQKAQNENVHDFLFRTKTGVCVEYATAMVMLSRAAGIPARYCEGYLMQNEWEGSSSYEKDRVWTGYSISPRDGHAFPELYIRGCGWVAFEPTMSNLSNTDAQKEEKSTTTDMLKKAGFVMLAIATAMLLLLVVMPYLTHKLFIFINRRREPDKAVAAVMHRLCRLYGIPATNTAGEASELIAAESGADITAAEELFSKMSYGGIPMTEADRDRAMADYITAYDALKESRKKKRKLKKAPQGGN